MAGKLLGTWTSQIWLRVRLTFVRWLVGWPIAAGWMSCWLTGHLTKCWPDPHSGSDFRLGWHFVRWLFGWSSDKIPLVYWCKRWTSTRSDLGSGWHLVRWLVSIADDWLVADWSSNKLSTIFWMKGLCEVKANCHSALKNQMTFLHIGRWAPLQTWYESGWHCVRWLVGWPIAAGWMSCWLTGHLTKCQPNPPSRDWLWVRLIFHQMACWLAGWLVHS